MTLSSVFLNILLQASADDPNRFNSFMILAYVVMWIIVVLYTLTLANRQRNAQEEVKLMQQLLKEDEEAATR